MLDVFLRVLPVHSIGGRPQDVLGNVLHSSVTVHNRVCTVLALCAKRQPQATVGNDNRGGAMAHGFGQARGNLQLQVVVGMNVKQPWHGPAFSGIDDLVRFLRIKVRPSCCDPAICDGDVFADR